MTAVQLNGHNAPALCKFMKLHPSKKCDRLLGHCWKRGTFFLFIAVGLSAKMEVNGSEYSRFTLHADLGGSPAAGP